MPVTNYNTYNGRIRSETTAGVTTGYLTDALGSVTATVNSAGVAQNTYRYKPYGGLLAKTGTAPDPAFMWTGDTGSRATGLAMADQYNEARHFATGIGGWTTVDAMWPAELPYVYASDNPVTFTDPLGRQVGLRGPAPTPPPKWWPYPPAPSPTPPVPPADPPGGGSPEGPVSVLLHLLGLLGKPCTVVGLTLTPTTLGAASPLPMLPLGGLVPVGSIPSNSDCNQLYNDYKAACAKPGSVKPHMTNCNAIGQLINNAKQCIDLRMKYLYGCDLGGGGASSPNACVHASAMCSLIGDFEDGWLHAQTTCDGYGSDVGRYVQLCYKWKRRCGNDPVFPRRF